MAKYISTKTYRQIGPVAYRQWRADSHCNLIHGYALSFHFEFECDTLDARNWCMDFGGLKDLKSSLEDWFDHTLLVAQDDPKREDLLNLGKLGLAKITEVEKTGCEGIAEFLYEYVNTIYLPMYGKTEAERIWCCKVEVRETDSNMAMRVGHRDGTMKLPFEEGLLEWLHTQYPYSKYHVVELNNEMAFEFSRET